MGPLGASVRSVTGMARAASPVGATTSEPATSPGVVGIVTDKVTGTVAPGAMVMVDAGVVPKLW